MKLGAILSGRVGRASAVFALLSWWPIALAAQQARSISGVVETEEGRRLAGVTVRITNVGGRPTSDSGEFTISLPPQFEPGSQIEFYVAGWIIKIPYQGREFIPREATATIHIIVMPNATRDHGPHPADLQPKAGRRAVKVEH